jgi:hypothetical protein
MPAAKEVVSFSFRDLLCFFVANEDLEPQLVAMICHEEAREDTKITGQLMANRRKKTRRMKRAISCLRASMPADKDSVLFSFLRFFVFLCGQ